jgi:YHS domain-containing protein/thiol-disulfide isomerase/thioredoxin
MNKLLVFVTVLASCCLMGQNLGAQQLNPSAIQWETNPYKASQKAAASSKLVLLHFTADWCGPCQNQRRFVFSSPEVARAISQVSVPVLVDIDANQALAQELNVRNVPYDVFLTPEGEVVGRRKSPSDTRNFVSMCHSINRMPAKLFKSQTDSIAEMKQNASPTSMTGNQRSDFRAGGPEAAGGVVASREGLQLSRRSGHQPRINASTRRSGHSGAQNLDPKVELNNALAGLAADLSASKQQKVKSRFFQIPEKRLDDPASAYDPATNEFHPHRASEHLERHAFLNRPRPAMELPQQAPAATPVRVIKNHFFNSGEHVEMSSVATIPGVQVSEMFSPVTGQQVDPYVAGPSVARIQKTTPTTSVTPAVPANELKIVSDSNARIQSYKEAETNFAQQASLTHEQDLPQPSGSIDTSIRAQPVDDFALHGKCPVALILQGQWLEGDVRWGIVHRDRTYLFSSQENYDLFKENPDRFSPVLSGFDPVIYHEQGKLLDGMEEHGVFMGKNDQQHVVLFQSPETRSKFQANPKLYMDTVRQAVFSASRANGDL